MKATGTRVEKIVFSEKDRHKGIIKQGCHLVKIVAVRYARVASGEILHTSSGEFAFEVVFQNKAGEQNTLHVWTTKAGMWIWKELCRAANIPYKEGEQIEQDKVVGRFLWIIVAGIYDSFNGKAVDVIKKHVVVPDKMYPYIKNMPQKFNSDPQYGGNPHNTMFAIYKEVATNPQLHEKTLFDDE